MDLDRFIVPLGIATYSCLFATVLTGLFRRRVKLKYHRILALTTIGLATLHAGIAFLASR